MVNNKEERNSRQCSYQHHDVKETVPKTFCSGRKKTHKLARGGWNTGGVTADYFIKATTDCSFSVKNSDSWRLSSWGQDSYPSSGLFQWNQITCPGICSLLQNWPPHPTDLLLNRHSWQTHTDTQLPFSNAWKDGDILKYNWTDTFTQGIF